MEFTLLFLKLFYFGIHLTAPILILLILTIIGLGQVAGAREAWSRAEALYWSFITATTVGYGDFRPLHGLSRVISILIAFCGIIFTGIVVAVAISATTHSLEAHYHLSDVKTLMEREIE